MTTERALEKRQFGHRARLALTPAQARLVDDQRVHRRWGMVNIPKVGRVRFRWTRDLPVGKAADKENRITGARLVKDALGWLIAFRIQTQAAHAIGRHPVRFRRRME